MRAFVSYSLNDSEQYVISLLSKKLYESGFFVTSGFDKRNKELTHHEIKSSHLFIGLLSQAGESNTTVFEEWRYAIKSRIPGILLVENTIILNKSLAIHPNVVRFDRKRPLQAIELVKQKIEKSTTSKEKLDNAVAWVLGGVATLALISMLSEE